MTNEQWASIMTTITTGVETLLADHGDDIRAAIHKSEAINAVDQNAKPFKYTLGISAKIGEAETGGVRVDTKLAWSVREQAEMTSIISDQPDLPGMEG